MARVINDDGARLVSSNKSTYVPTDHRHRLENPEAINPVMIEMQSGEYLGEDDVVCFEGQYGRVV